MPRLNGINKVLLVGSGPIVIGQAAEFDYSGTQSLLALKEEGIQTILVNSNPATIQTDPGIADVVYIEPLTVDFLEKIIIKERPDAILANAGGQTALNLATQLDARGILARYNVRVLGTDIASIKKGEDREEFAALMRQIGQPVLPSVQVSNVEDALTFSHTNGYPIIIRAAFTLGGSGSGVAHSEPELIRLVAEGLKLSAVGRVLVERSILGWGEFEYEVIRDAADNAIVVCNMENLDPMGVHTGDSIVIAPSQTLSDDDHQVLRNAALTIIRAVGVLGGCNVQFSFNLQTGEYFVIEINPRLSRSSALASKATGYPIARVAAKIALGYTLPEIVNQITGTSACFEPALDYVVIKIPRWPFDKFKELDNRLGVLMKSTGEVMAIGRNFEEALQKAVRGLDLRRKWLGANEPWTPERIQKILHNPTQERLEAIYQAFTIEMSDEEIIDLSGINPWFITKLRHVWSEGQSLRKAGKWIRHALLESPASPDLYLGGDDQGVLPQVTPQPVEIFREAKRYGFSDAHLASMWELTEAQVRGARLAAGVVPTYKMVDTCAGEFAARTPYFYSTYASENEAISLPGPKVIIIGAGPIRIGQGIEFDYSTVHAIQALRDAGIKAIIINNNPETVSTDFNISDRLYFEPLTFEEVLNVCENEAEGLLGVVPQFGGQTAINLVAQLHDAGIKILGTPPETIDLAEDREKCSVMLKQLGIPMPKWGIIRSPNLSHIVAKIVGYPALIRPSYVLGGRGMKIVYSDVEMDEYLRESTDVSFDHPVMLDHFLQDAVEVDVDALSDGKTSLSIIMEQIEEAGIHSGDSACVYPPQTLSDHVIKTIEDYTNKVAQEIGVIGLMNIQYAVKDETVFILEINPRASRTVPFAAKCTGIPLARVAMQVIMGTPLASLQLTPRKDRVSVKETVLPFKRLTDLDPVLRPEMQSTGEAMGIDLDFGRAFYKAELAAGIKALPHSGRILLILEGAQDAERIARLASSLNEVDFEIFVTQETATLLEGTGLKYQIVQEENRDGKAILALFDAGLELLVNIPRGTAARGAREYSVRRRALELDLPYITSIAGFEAFVKAVRSVGQGEGVSALDVYRI